MITDYSIYLLDFASKMFKSYLGWNSPYHQLEDSILAIQNLKSQGERGWNTNGRCQILEISNLTHISLLVASFLWDIGKQGIP